MKVNCIKQKCPCSQTEDFSRLASYTSHSLLSLLDSKVSPFCYTVAHQKYETSAENTPQNTQKGACSKGRFSNVRKSNFHRFETSAE